jgi:hypothetical protein
MADVIEKDFMCEEDQIKQSDLRLFAMAYNNQKAL